MEPLLFVAEREGEQRLGERLARLGVPLELVAASRLSTAQRGECYVLTAERAASFQPETITSAGAHLCVIPPWPSTGLSLEYSCIAPVATARRDPIQLDRALAAMVPASDQAPHRLTIAYREHLPGLAGKVLGVSLSGETVLLALPRVSNLHGLLIVTTLLVGQPSTQTVDGDVVRLLQTLAAWMLEYTERRASQERQEQTTALFDTEGERLAQLVLLALALHLTESQTSAGQLSSTPVSSAEVLHLAEQIADLLGLPMSPVNFQRGWQAMETIGILTSSSRGSLDGQQEVIMLVDWAKVAERVSAWQLDPRLRRLRQRMRNIANL